MNYKYKITLFTPTFNRAYILETLYRSVQRQTFRDFEWIIMDDGSSDNTEELVRGWIEDNNDFPIRFYKVPNGGKCRAINRGLDLAEGELFFIMDSDDYLTDDSLETVVKWEATIAGKPGYCGVAGNRGSSPTETPNTRLWQMYGEGCQYIDEYAYCRYPEYTDKVIDGERAGVWYTEIHRKYKYPEFDGENFLTPCITWNRMAKDGYKIRIFDDIIWICEYRADGLTMQGNMRFIKNPAGHGLSIREKADFLNYPMTEKIKMWYTFYCDHTFCDEKYRLTKAQCAEYIGAPLPFIWLSAFIHDTSNAVKKVFSRK